MMFVVLQFHQLHVQIEEDDDVMGSEIACTQLLAQARNLQVMPLGPCDMHVCSHASALDGPRTSDVHLGRC